MKLLEAIQGIMTNDMTSVFSDVAMVVITIISVISAFGAYIYQKNRNKKKAACELALHYADVILGENRYITNVFSKSGVSDLIHTIIGDEDMYKLRDFDLAEMEGILKKKNIELDVLKSQLNGIEAKIILSCRALRDVSSAGSESAHDKFVVTNDVTGEQRIPNEAMLQMDFTSSVYDLLNHLEWFSMNCRYRVADEELLYQSLHQTYISMIWMLYPIICMNNTNNENKMYTNAIWLFLKWRNRLKKIEGRAERKRNRLKKIADRVQAMADNIRAKEFSGKRL